MFVLKHLGYKYIKKRNQWSSNEGDTSSTTNLTSELDNNLFSFSTSTEDVNAKVFDKKIHIGNKKKIQVTEDEVCTGRCKCRNCRKLVELTECGVCFETLQSSQVRSCPVCANIVCVACASRLTSCAFCRSGMPAERNRALERLVDTLSLPCKNFRSGCCIMLDGESRFMHESMCNFSIVSCPVDWGVCGWRGTAASIRTHLFTKHQLEPLQTPSLTIRIKKFRQNISTANRRIHTEILECFEQLFVIKIILNEDVLRIVLARLGPESTDVAPTVATARYGVSVLLLPRGSQKRSVLVPFGRYDRENRTLNFTCDNLYPNSNDYYSGHDDSVKVDLLLRRLDQC